MALLARYRHNSVEVKNYTIKYADWLEEGENLASVAFTLLPVTTPPLAIVGNVDPIENEVLMTVGDGGVDGETYDITVTVTTDQSQVKRDCIEVSISDEC